MESKKLITFILQSVRWVTQPFNAAIKTLEEGNMTDQNDQFSSTIKSFSDGFVGKLEPFISEAIALERLTDGYLQDL